MAPKKAAGVKGLGMFAIVNGIFGSKRSVAVAAITIRNMEESLKEGLRQRAAASDRFALAALNS